MPATSRWMVLPPRSSSATTTTSRAHRGASSSTWTSAARIEQRDALASILLGELGGEAVLRLPWVRKPSELIDVVASPIEILSDASGHELRVGRAVTLKATQPFATDEVVACGIPGYDSPGTELLADELVVEDGRFSWALSGNCAFASPFDYSS